jgi:hypothetical protein
VQEIMTKTVRVGNGQAFWGDWAEAPVTSVTHGQLNYLTLDYLAELTMSLLNKQRQRDPNLGYAGDFVHLMRRILPLCMERGVKVVTNAGGLNPEGCRAAVVEVAKSLGINRLSVASVGGDDLMPRLSTLIESGVELCNLDTGEPISTVQDRLVSANAYIGSRPIADALQGGADIVIAGRCTDSALVLGPLMYEFGWSDTDFDRLAGGIIAGHLLECGPHSTGGNFEGGWWEVPGLATIGYPIAEVSPDGQFVVSKPEGTGGLVNFHSVAEQLLYEMGDPSAFLSPDVTTDITGIQLTEVGKDQVLVSGVAGRPPTDQLKVSAAYSLGYSAVGTLAFPWPGALAKARRAAEMLIERIDRLGLHYQDLRVDFIGASAILDHLSPADDGGPAEVMMRIAIRGEHREDLTKFGRELAPIGIAGPAAACGFGGRPSPSEVFAFWPALIPKSAVKASIEFEEVGVPWPA